MKSEYHQFQVKPVQISDFLMREISEALRISGNCNNTSSDGYGRFEDEVTLLIAIQDFAYRNRRFVREAFARGEMVGLS